MTIFERTRETAKQQGMNLQTLAERAELSPNSIYNWRRSNPKSENVEAVAKVLNVSVDYLLGNIEEPDRAQMESVFIVELMRLLNVPTDIDNAKTDHELNIRLDFFSREVDRLITLTKLLNPDESKKFSDALKKIDFQDVRIKAEVDRLVHELDIKSETKQDETLKRFNSILEDLQSLSEMDKEKSLNKLEDYARGLIDAYKD